MQKILRLRELVELAKMTEENDPIDWDLVDISPDTAYGMMAAHVIDIVEHLNAEDREVVMMSVMVKLLVENLVLNAALAEWEEE